MTVPVEPNLITDPELADILEELSSREIILHHPELGMTRTDLEKMITDDFWEVGASGRRYSRAFVLQVLEQRLAEQDADVWATSDFYCRRLGPDVYLLTYALIQNKTRRTLRSSIWQRTSEDWKCVYHQGTVIQES